MFAPRLLQQEEEMGVNVTGKVYVLLPGYLKHQPACQSENCRLRSLVQKATHHVDHVEHHISMHACLIASLLVPRGL